MAKQRDNEPEDLSINMTPMIDCVFQLIIFFILAGQAASQSLARVELYEPIQSQALKWDEEYANRVIVNVPSMIEDPNNTGPMSTQARAYMIQGREYEVGDTEALVELFEQLYAPHKEQGDEYFVEIRADYRVQYDQVSPILYAAAVAEIRKMNITALLSTRPME